MGQQKLTGRGGAGRGQGRPRGSPNAFNVAVAKAIHRTITAERTVELIADLANYDIGALFDAKGDLRPLHKLTREERLMVSGLEVVMKNATAGDGKIDRVLKVKLAPREKYIEMAAKYHKLLVDKVEVDADWDKWAARLASARERE